MTTKEDITNPWDPYRLDPKKFYILRAQELALKAEGVEALAYRIFGTQVMGSIAFAVDPLRGFRRVGKQATPTNRSQKFTAYGTPNVSKRIQKTNTILGVQPPDLSTPDPFDRIAYSESSSSSSTTTTAGTQGLIQGEILDTTFKSRPLGSLHGEFELWKPRVICKTRSRTTWSESVVETTSPAKVRNRTATVGIKYFSGPSSRVIVADVNAKRATMKTNLLGLMGSNVIPMLNTINPQRRIFSLAYSVGELKDAHLLLKNKLEYLMYLRKGALTKKASKLSRHAAQEYVSYKFGWAQMFQDIDRLVHYPERFAKKVNFLMRRNGELTTLRAERELLPVPDASPPAFAHYLFTGESVDSTTLEAEVQNTLKLVVKTVIDMPRLEVPKVRDTLWYGNLGVTPTPEDVYNLVPWSWLIDWFTGLGDYVQMYDTVNFDPKLVDYGFITGISTLRAKSVLVTRDPSVTSRKVLPPIDAPTFTDTNLGIQTSEGRLEATLHIRRSLTSAYGVKPAWNLGLFSGAQLTILGALFHMKTPQGPIT